MSDITHSRRATEFLEQYAQTDRLIPGEDLIKAGVHAGLATARAVRELDTTTRQVNRLTADSIDELAGDLMKLLRRPPLLVRIDEVWINPSRVSIIRPHADPALTVIGLADGDVALVRGEIAEVASRLSEAVA